MKKIIFLSLTCIICLALIESDSKFLTRQCAYALEDTPLIDMRNKIFQESKMLKSVTLDSKDIILLNSLRNTCITTATQLDAYFSMIAIFNTIKKEARTQEAMDYLVNWLELIKKTNSVNISTLKAINETLEPKTKLYTEKLKSYFIELESQVKTEINKVSLIKKSIKRR